MGYIHIIAEMKKSSKSKEKTKYHIQVDCVSEDDALENILVPYASNASRILIDGAFVSASDIEKVTVFKSTDDSKTLYERESAESDARSSRMAAQGVIGFFGTTMYAAICNQANDITTEILREAIKRA